MRSLSEHLEAPALGEPPDGTHAAIEGCAGGSCGVVVRIFLDVRDGVVHGCTSRVRGRASALATASALCEAARGRTVLEAAKLGLSTLHQSFGEMDAEDVERARVVEDGFHHAIGRWFLARMRAGDHDAAVASSAPGECRPHSVVAMSGGVDSAVALHLEHERTGGNVVGATLRLWIDPRAPDPEAACCSPDSVRRARATCHALGAPHVSLDLRSEFARQVVVPFVDQYQAGETPNPCVGCNGGFRLDELVRLADAAGAREVATGHYARTSRLEGRTLLRRGVDERKDQSYMLARLAPDTVARYRFPLGEMRKPEVRERAAALGLEQAKVAESQEVCFLGGGDYRTFLGRANALGTAGKIRMTDGTELAEHRGIAAFTPGQRRGLAVTRPAGRLRGDSSGSSDDNRPLYVISTDATSGTVTVGDREQLAATRVRLRDARSWLPHPPTSVYAQLRYRSGGTGVPATATWLDGGRVELELLEPAWAPAPGQTACLYDESGTVVGVGTIERPGPARS